MDALSASDRCSPMVQDLLDLVQRHLLIVDPRGRMQAVDLEKQLSAMITKAQDDAYLLGESGILLPQAVPAFDDDIKLPRRRKSDMEEPPSLYIRSEVANSSNDEDESWRDDEDREVRRLVKGGSRIPTVLVTYFGP
jgi:hypothetical protein